MTVSATFYTGRRSGIGNDKEYQMTTATSRANKGIQVLAGAANTVKVFVGPSGITADSADATDGYPLSAGESVLFPVRTPSEIFVIAAGSGTGQKVWWMIV